MMDRRMWVHAQWLSSTDARCWYESRAVCLMFVPQRHTCMELLWLPVLEGGCKSLAEGLQGQLLCLQAMHGTSVICTFSGQMPGIRPACCIL